MTPRVRHSLDAFLWTGLSQVLSISMSFIIRSILIKKLGAEYLGLSGLFTSLLGVLNLAELGLGSVIVYYLYKPFAEDDKVLINAILAFFKKIYIVVGTIVLIIGIILSFFLKNFIKGDIPDNINIYVVFYFYLLNSVLSYFLWAYKIPLFTASQRTDLVNKILCLVYLFQYGTQIAVLFLFKNFYLYTLVLPLSSIIQGLLNVIVIYKMFPNYHAEGKLEKLFYNNFFKRVSGMAFTRFRNVSRSGIDTVFVSSFLGLAITAKYNIYVSVLFVPIVILNGIILPGLEGSIGNFFATESKESQYNFFNLYTFIVLWLITWETSCYLCLVQGFVILWVGVEQTLHLMSIFLFSCSFFIQGISLIFEKIKDANGLYLKRRFCPLIEMGLNITLNFIGVKYFGIPGVIAATCISILLVTIPNDMYVVFKYQFNKSILKYLLFFIYRIIISVFAIAVTYCLCTKITMSNLIIQGFIKIMLCVFVPNIILLVFSFKSKYLKSAIQMIKKR